MAKLEGGTGYYKSIVARDDTTITLKSRFGEMAREAVSGIGFDETTLSDSEAQSYAIGQFYLRRLLHAVYQDYFPDCYFASNTTFVNQMAHGEPHSWEEITHDLRRNFTQLMKQIGLSLSFIDTSSAQNFFIGDNQTPTYIDSVVNTRYFTILHMIRLEEQKSSYYDDLDDRDFLNQISFLISALSLESSLVRTEIDFEVLEKYIKQASHLDNTQRKKIEALIDRLKYHYSKFPDLPKEKAAKALKAILIRNKDKVKRIKPRLPKNLQIDLEKFEREDGLFKRVRGLFS